jgi:hypothetical protein
MSLSEKKTPPGFIRQGLVFIVAVKKLSGRRVSNPVNPQPRMIIIKVIALVKTLILGAQTGSC